MFSGLQSCPGRRYKDNGIDLHLGTEVTKIDLAKKVRTAAALRAAEDGADVRRSAEHTVLFAGPHIFRRNVNAGIATNSQYFCPPAFCGKIV